MDAKIPCVIMRGGTSKGIFLLRRDLPDDPARRDALILAVFGSPDRRQIDGLGGAEPLTSKLAIIAPSERPDADVEYTFGQVGIDEANVNYAATCGNIAAAVGPFAIDEGLVPAREPSTRVRIFNTNTGKTILADVPVQDGRACARGDCAIHGVPGRGPEIRLTFVDPAGAITGRLLPTGHRSEQVAVDGATPLTVSVVDAGTLFTFVSAAQLGLTGTESAERLEAMPGLMALVDGLRRALAERLLGLGVVDATLAQRLGKSLKVALVGPGSEGAHVSARIINPGKVHKAFAVTGAVAIGAAAVIDGTVVQDLLGDARVGNRVVLAHPAGVMAVELDAGPDAAGVHLAGVAVVRTARRIMAGDVYVARELAVSPAVRPAALVQPA